VPQPMYITSKLNYQNIQDTCVEWQWDREFGRRWFNSRPAISCDVELFFFGGGGGAVLPESKPCLPSLSASCYHSSFDAA
jgi:hypothetical protein